MKTLARVGVIAVGASIILPTSTAVKSDITTVYANSTHAETQWVYDAKNAGEKSMTYVHGGEAISAASVGDGWFKITSGSNAGKFVFRPSTTQTDKPVAKGVTRYAGVDDLSSFYHAPNSGITNASVAPTSALKGDLYANGWMQVSDAGRHAGLWQKNTTATNGYDEIETQQWRNVAGFKAAAPRNVTVTRYALANNASMIRVHSAPSYSTSSATGTIPTNTELVGRYHNSHWFHITSGAYAGKYVSTAMIWTTNDQKKINGHLASNDVCQVPNAMRTVKDKHDQFMGCESLSQLEALSADEKATYGFGVALWEAYRDYATQVEYLNEYGSPQAAQPGTSNHGLGNAFDMRYTKSSDGVLSFTSPQVVDFLALSADFGWTKPASLDKGAKNPEPWHFEMFG